MTKKNNAAVEKNIDNVTRGLEEFRVSRQEASKVNGTVKKPEIAKKIVEDTGKKSMDPKNRREDGEIISEGHKKRVEGPAKVASSSKDKPISKPASGVHSPTSKQHANDESFTNLKRDTVPKPTTKSKYYICNTVNDGLSK